jgi:glycosyl transferase family 25
MILEESMFANLLPSKLFMIQVKYPMSTFALLIMNAFKYLNSYYDKIYILTLPRLKDRMDYVNKTFEGLNFEFFFGVDKENNSMEEFKKNGTYSTEHYKTFYKSPPDMPLGMLCCALGHLNIYQEIIKNGYQRTLILEDDAVPVMQAIEEFPQIINEIPDDLELLYLGYEKNEGTGMKEKVKHFFYQLFPSNSQLKLNRQIFGNYYPRPVSKHISKAGFHDCTHAYSITLEAAKKLLAAQQPVRFHPDNLVSYLNCTDKLNGYIAKPKMFTQLSAFKHHVDSLTGN